MVMKKNIYAVISIFVTLLSVHQSFCQVTLSQKDYDAMIAKRNSLNQNYAVLSDSLALLRQEKDSLLASSAELNKHIDSLAPNAINTSLSAQNSEMSQLNTHNKDLLRKISALQVDITRTKEDAKTLEQQQQDFFNKHPECLGFQKEMEQKIKERFEAFQLKPYEISDQFEQELEMLKKDALSLKPNSSTRNDIVRAFDDYHKLKGYYYAFKPDISNDELERFTKELKSWSEKEKSLTKKSLYVDYLHNVYSNYCSIVFMFNSQYDRNFSDLNSKTDLDNAKQAFKQNLKEKKLTSTKIFLEEAIYEQFFSALEEISLNNYATNPYSKYTCKNRK